MNQEFKASLKSADTEEHIDIYFYRPIGYQWARFFRMLHVTPNVVTILSIFLGVGAGICFYFDDLAINVLGIFLLIWANVYDSCDGQLARLTNQKSALGRILDGAAGDFWFVSIYFAISFRLMPEWGWKIWALCIVAGFGCHAIQSRLADYYRQIHLFFLKGKEGSELDKSEEQWRIFREQPKKALFFRAFYYNYAKYGATQERRTKNFQLMMAEATNRYGAPLNLPAALKEEFLAGSRPLMKYTNLLTFNMRAIALYIACLIDLPWLYLLFEIVVMNIMYIYMHHEHENLCHKMVQRIVACSEAKATKENENKEESDENKESEDCHNTDIKED